jgi:hypothetical protein
MVYRPSRHAPASAKEAVLTFGFLILSLPLTGGILALFLDAPARLTWGLLLGGPALLGVLFGSFHVMGKRLEDKERRDQERIDFDVPAVPALPPIVSEPAALVLGPRKPSGQCVRCRRALPEEANDTRVCAHGCGALLSHAAVDDVLARAHLELGVVRELAKERGLEKHPCPSCASSMRETELRGLRVDLCLSCGSMWVDEGERARLAREDAFATHG